MSDKKANEVDFSEVKEQLAEKIRAIQGLDFGESVSLIDGFFYNDFKSTWDNKKTLGGQTIVSIMLIGNETGRIYHFPIKKFFPNFPKID